MRWLFVICVLMLGTKSAGADTIAEVLQRSQAMRLASFETAASDSPRARTVRHSFETLIGTLHPSRQVELRVIRGAVIAETLQGQIVVANESLADWSEADRQFVLAHEIGHVEMQHWAQMELVFEKWMPGTLNQAATDAVAARFGRDASRLAYRQEFEADAFAARAMAALSSGPYDAMAVFMRLGAYKDTATHPGTQRRLAALRAPAMTSALP